LLYPRVMGSRVGLSPLVVLVAMILWGWLLGPVGLILSVPLVAAVKIVADAYAPARWLAILLGNA
ncbi:MAG: AI-2E family transporter, partial [Caldilinea sp.]|nr:AI-2E family transporter [Caldilinea sp.]